MSSTSFQDAASATSDTSGAYAVIFQSVRLGFIWTGSVQIPSAVSSSVLPVKFTAFDSGIPIGSWYNDQSSPNLQVQQQLSVTASGLTASTKFQAFFKGMITPSAETPPFWPGPTPAPPPSGFTTIVSGITNATAITVNPQYLNAVGSPVGSPVWFPVVVGTALEIAYFGANAVNQRLTPLWSTTGTGAGTIVHNADTFDLSFVAPNNVMQGMTYLNHGPFVAFLIQGVGGTPQFVVNTGLPPVVRPPSVPQGILKGTAGFINIPSGENSFPLPPYVGPALIGGEFANATANGIDVRIHSVDYLGTILVEGPWAVTSQTIAGSSDNILPILVYLPPVINSLVVANRTAGAVNGSYYCIPIGP